MLDRPPLCRSCQLDRFATGFVPPDGPPGADLLYLGEAAGGDEARIGRPFIGAAGTLLNRAMDMARIQRPGIRFANCISCQPPKNKLERTSYEYPALAACRSNYLDPTIEQWLATGDPSRKVMVPLGGTALRSALGLGKKGVRVQDFHSTVQRDPTDRFWVVPNYHPSHIQRGAFNLLPVLVFGLQTAMEVSQGKYLAQPLDLILDPAVEWFRQWAHQLLAIIRQDPDFWLAVDIETPDKAAGTDEGELSSKITGEDRSFHILRVNFSYNPDQGVTVPYEGPYIPIIEELLSSPVAKIFWNAPYDVPRLLFHGHKIAQPIHDAMWWWHHLQSDLPRGLGFVAPFYSHYGPWKHLAHEDPVLYAAIDGPQTLRAAFGIAEDLRSQGQWETCFRHVYELDAYCLRPAEEVGMLVDQVELEKMRLDLEEKHNRTYQEIQEVVPQELLRLHPKDGWKSMPTVEDLDALNETRQRKGEPFLVGEVVEVEVERTIKVCLACDAQEIAKTHRCQGGGTPVIELAERRVTRYFIREEFNPGSPKQLLGYILARGHKPGVNKEGNPSTDKETMQRLVKTGDPLYTKVAYIRKVDKVKNTYVDGTFTRLRTDPRSIRDGRLHPTTTHKPSTQRLSMQAPNLQNVIADREADNPAIGFRKCLVAAEALIENGVEAEEEAYLVEADFSGIEAVETGWFSGDPQYIRLAKLGVHAYVTSHLVGEPADLSLSDRELSAYFKHIKEEHPYEYDQCKRCVHGTNYGLTEFGMVRQFPKEFPTLKAAQHIQGIYFAVAPNLPRWQMDVKEFAAKHHYLGGKIDTGSYNPTCGFHPYGYKHWYFNVLEYRPVKGVASKRAQVVRIGGRNFQVRFGEDSKRAVSFFPQSTAAGVIKEAMLRLFTPGMPNYIGDVWRDGRTPLRAQIHDSLLLEVPKSKVEWVISRLVAEMIRPIKQQPMPLEWGLGSHLQIGVEVKVGKNWSKYHPKDNPDPRAMKNFTVDIGLANDRVVPLDEYDEDYEALEGEKEEEPAVGAA